MKISLYGILLLFLVACQSNVEKDGIAEPSDSTQTDTIASSNDVVNYALDFKGEKWTYSISPLSKEEFMSLKEVTLPAQDKIIDVKCDASEDCEKKNEKVNMQEFAQLVQRNGDSLILKCGQNGERFVAFVDEKSEEDNMSTYSFVHKYENPEVYLVAGTYYESFDYKLVNRKTCKVIDVISEPIFSPNRKKAIFTNEDLVAGFTFNGMEVIAFQDTAMTKEASQEFTNWAIDNAKWISDSELKITQLTPNYTSEETKEDNKRFAILKIK